MKVALMHSLMHTCRLGNLAPSLKLSCVLLLAELQT